ncbi:FAD-dependent oxidoreductase [Roseomonas chloroacetimidivorans]|uniref:FAD-dependent oxidoreductase n=1 Tax=Roseomonas chloroacetimidivorans TaxID=1766656 RepID=UPI003C732F4D
MENIVIVGAGHAGVELAHALRKEGFGGRVTLVSDEPDLPYQRPPLSKDFLKRDGARPLLLKAEALYGQNRIELRLKSKVVAIDRERKCVRFESGEELVYDHLALATGARNRRLDIPGLDHPAILELRGLGVCPGNG